MSLISKKDLLAITGISYGQLYRWKRERLIPEEWFIKQSSYTGQETFFPREQILSRIKSILDMKDDYSLEELARMLSPERSSTKIRSIDIAKIEEINEVLIRAMTEVFQKEEYDFYEITLLAALSGTVKKMNLSDDKAKGLLRRSIPAAMTVKNMNVTCTIFSDGAEIHTLFFPSQALRPEFDSDIQVMDYIHLSEITDKIKMKYKNLFI